MGWTIGIDLGSTGIKVVGVKEEIILEPLQLSIPANPESARDALFAYLRLRGLDIRQIKEVRLTGIGTTRHMLPITQVPTHIINEFVANGIGGTRLAGVADAIVISVGTGTSFTKVNNGHCIYCGGTALGGGTLASLSAALLGGVDAASAEKLAQDGNLLHIDLCIHDITESGDIPHLPPEVTVANLGKLSPRSAQADVALGLHNLVLQPVCTMAHMLSQGHYQNFVFIGMVVQAPFASMLLDLPARLYHVNCIVPEYAAYATALGAIYAPIH